MLLYILQCSSPSSTQGIILPNMSTLSGQESLLSSNCKWLCSGVPGPVSLPTAWFTSDEMGFLRLWECGTLPVLCNGCFCCSLIVPLFYVYPSTYHPMPNQAMIRSMKLPKLPVLSSPTVASQPHSSSSCNKEVCMKISDYFHFYSLLFGAGSKTF